MAQIGTIQVAGNANAGPIEVDLNTLAARSVIRPDDLYSGPRISWSTPGNGILKNGTSAGTIVAWSNHSVFMMLAEYSQMLLIRGIYVTMNVSGATTASSYTMNLVLWRGVQAIAVGQNTQSSLMGISLGSPSGDTATSSQGKAARILSNRRNNQSQNIAHMLWTTAATGQFNFNFVASAPTGGVPLADQVLASITGSSTAAGSIIFPTRTPLFEAKAGDHPLILSANELLSLQLTSSTADTTTTCQLDYDVGVVFDELPANLNY